VNRHSLDDAASQFAARGWVAVDVLPRSTRALLATWADEVAALDESTGVLQHRERTDVGTQLCRSEHFVDVHAGLRALLTTGPMLETASALLGEPAVLYKEKINHKLPGGAGYSAHQDAPAYPMIETHVSALVAIDDADAANGGLEVVSECFDRVLPLDARGCVDPAVADSLTWEAVDVPAGTTLWFHSRTPHRSAANRSGRARRALYPTYNAAREGDRRADYYAAKAAAFASELPAPVADERARVSLIGDFEGRPA
jgi:ectoine hydroxylase-related dioxygenase (phytanoyl-CoA dioxygenase family)